MTFDMARTTWAALELFAKAQGKTLDAILQGVMGKHLERVVKLKALKNHHHRENQLAELREEQRKLQVEIAKYEKRGE